ncbi:hypothetical protein QJS66_16660 [Kocuria rhizophila]|nr:hypothetical protein QJS66_16660 [Kocuria rhizophila]
MTETSSQRQEGARDRRCQRRREEPPRSGPLPPRRGAHVVVSGRYRRRDACRRPSRGREGLAVRPVGRQAPKAPPRSGAAPEDVDVLGRQRACEGLARPDFSPRTSTDTSP